MNKKLDASTLSDASGFTFYADDQELTLLSISSHPDNDRMLILEAENNYNDAQTLTLDYNQGSIKATDGSLLESFSALSITNNLPFYTPIPTLIEAEDYLVNEGLAHENTSDIGGGENLGYTNAGDYLEYNLYVAEEGTYTIQARIACDNSAGILEFAQIDQDGKKLSSAQLDVPVTGGWQTWQTVSTDMDMVAGRHTFRVTIIQPEFNINWFKLSEYVLEADAGTSDEILLYPNPCQDQLTLERKGIDQQSSISILDLSGKAIKGWNYAQSSSSRVLDLTGLKAGLYFVELKTQGQVWRQKFVKE
ncbi:carbohydrate-binding protein [Reichenbachiella ulvae]|uniref:Carbohydrate-binding protein n=1 Tax=Reichenbachiella ulvae TaxID=2980104 RepID=A0ABT3CPJ2_9BACT|nr:carbohydrate-binding protein [Reichenbachiella ulvae]MCV9385532.1 carbohydrate-binding protein [Reichenbachiella ulvae]